MSFWDNLVEFDVKKHDELSKHNYIKSKESVVDTLNDDPNSDSADLDDSNAGTDDSEGVPDDMSGGGGADDGGMGDMGGMDGADDTDDGMEEPTQIKKDQFTTLNGALELIAKFDKLISYAEQARDVEFSDSEIVRELDTLIAQMSDYKSRLSLYTNAENMTRYMLYAYAIRSILQRIREKTNHKSVEFLDLVTKFDNLEQFNL